MQKLRPVPPPKPHRLSLSDILGMVLSRGSGEHDKVALGRSARGETTIEVEVRTREDETVVDAEKRAVEVYERLRAKYPMSTGYVGANDK
jgi:hypothetical protein